MDWSIYGCPGCTPPPTHRLLERGTSFPVTTDGERHQLPRDPERKKRRLGGSVSPRCEERRSCHRGVTQPTTLTDSGTVLPGAKPTARNLLRLNTSSPFTLSGSVKQI
ncbi:hypothetical protein AMECASPLE_034407 [Ameca splendens]|uniref:Uncharacterized protein n=1 Tax=Ameca splendens TaxID=208324 RepID=A0ABV0ZSY0_9TELE